MEYIKKESLALVRFLPMSNSFERRLILFRCFHWFPFLISSDFLDLDSAGRVSNFGPKKKHLWESIESYWIYLIFQWSQILLKMIWNASVWDEFASYNLATFPNCSPPTAPSTPQLPEPCHGTQEALLSLCQQQGFDAVSLVTCVGSLQKATTWEVKDIHGESWRC